ncbi:MAG: hypothetical protein ACJASQ_000994 [Crocinitomicaceae bacterium]|jgi:hypothetical protein
MRKQFLAILLISFTNLLYSQEFIENIITKEHKNVTGTKVSLIPAIGFTKADNFNGFQQNESGSSIMVVEMPTSISALKVTFTKEALLSQGIELEEIKELKINDLSAILITGSQSANGALFSKIILVIGNDNEVVLINCAYPNGFTEIGKEITKSILSVVYLEDLEVDPLDGVDYTVNTDSTDLILAKSIANSLIYTHDGKFPTESGSKANLIIAKSHSRVSIEDRKLFALNRIKQTPFDIEEIDSTVALSIDRITGYGVYAKGVSQSSGIKYELYQVILFSDHMYYIFFGSTALDDKKTLEEMRLIVESFERK